MATSPEEGSAVGRGWDRAMVAAFGALIAGGALLVLSPHSFPLAWLDAAVAREFFESGSVPGGAAELQSWLYAVEGATLVAFGVLGLAVARSAYQRRERWGRNALAGAVALWFPLDTAASLLYGVWENAVLNAVIAAALLLPILATWKQFPRKAPE